MPHPEPEDSRVVSVRLPTTLVQRLDRVGDWPTTHRRRPTTRNAALREAGGAWLDQHEQLAGLLDPESLRQQCRAASDSQRPSPDGVPIPRLRRLLQWPRERFDTVLEALRAAQALDLEPLPAQTFDTQATRDSSQVHGQCYGHLRWRAGGTWLRGPPLGGLWPWCPALASAPHPRYHRPPHFASMDDSLSHAAGGSVALAQVRLRVSRAPPGPGTACPRGACREALPVRPSSDADDAQLPCLDPRQYRYELIRPLLLCPERTATQRAQETGTHPETGGRLKRRFAQQGMLGLVPDTLDVHPAHRQLRGPDTVVAELQRLKGLSAGFGARELARIIFHTTMYRLTGHTARRLWDRLPPAAPPTRPRLDYHSHPERVQARQEVMTL